MNYFTKVCDVCKKSANDKDNREIYDLYSFIEIHCNQYDNWKRVSNSYELCPECLKKLGFVREKTKPDEQTVKSLQDRLFEIMVEIVLQSTQF